MSSASSAVADLGKRLLEASRLGNSDEVRHLMATGAPLTTDWLGTSPLHLASQYGHIDTAEVLLRAGVSRDGKTKVDKTPLHLACQHGHVDIVRLLVSNGAAVNMIDMLFMSPLHWACEAQSPVICKLLLEAGAKQDIRNKFGKTPMDIVKVKGYYGCLKVLSQDYSTCNEIRRQIEHQMAVGNDGKRRARTRKFPMTAGSWTGESNLDKRDKIKGERARQLTTEYRKDIDTSLISHPTSLTSGLSQDLQLSPTEGNLSSLVDAAAIVRSKVENNISNTQRAITASSDMKGRSSIADTSVDTLDTLATLATATAAKANPLALSSSAPSHASNALAHSYITIPGVHGPIALHQGHGGMVNPANLTQALPAGYIGGIQLASPLALNILPGLQGRVQVGQHVNHVGAQLNVPIQGHVQSHSGVPVGGYVTTTHGIVAPGTTLSIVGGMPANQAQHKGVTGGTHVALSGNQPTTTTIHQGMSHTTEPSQNTIPINLPLSVLNSIFGGNVTLSNVGHSQQGMSLHDVRSPTAKSPAGHYGTQAISVANLGSDMGPISVVPVANIGGGFQFLPSQAVLQNQIVNALRGAIPQSNMVSSGVPQQGVMQGNTVTIPISPLNLSNILPTAVSLSQLPVHAQQQVAASGLAGTGQVGSMTPVYAVARTSGTATASSSYQSNHQVLAGQAVTLQAAGAQQIQLSPGNHFSVNRTSNLRNDVLQANRNDILQAANVLMPQTQSSAANVSPMTSSNVSTTVNNEAPPRSHSNVSTTSSASSSTNQYTSSASSSTNQYTSSASSSTNQYTSSASSSTNQYTSSASSSTNQYTSSPSSSTSQYTPVSQVSALLSSPEILPQLQQLIYKQLMQQQQHVYQADSTQDASQTADSSQDSDRASSPVPLTHQLAEATVQQQQQQEQQQQQQLQSNLPSSLPAVDLLKFLEQARAEEAAKEDLKRQLVEAQLKNKKYEEELEKAQRQLNNSGSDREGLIELLGESDVKQEMTNDVKQEMTNDVKHDPHEALSEALRDIQSACEEDEKQLHTP